MSQALTSSQVVSSEQESLILVDSDDRETGFLGKSACHDGGGVLHRAFSLFVFNPAGQLLIHQRASAKRLWPDYWSNSCCSHPRRGEDMAEAIQRRLSEELGLQTPMNFLYKFEYTADYQGIGTEHELCWVYAGRTDAEPVINTTEIKDWRWIDPADLGAELRQESNRFTPWFRMEWERIERDFKTAFDV
ncbi:MAG: isopentenyl-diphosphate Delta-isomerase [Gammaproteobacteria bacterium]|nr:isopentenyl-diphosphate Delta-isomerase [Gammaproteobacteria bacterium]